MNNIYKITQLLHFFVTKFSYKTVMMQDNIDKELWLVNPDNKTYSIIRVTVNSIEQVIYEKSRIDDIIFTLKKQLRMPDAKFLDIHIGKDYVLENEAYDSVAIDDNYYDGVDISYAYPGIKSAVHNSDNPNAETHFLLEDINQTIITKKKQNKQLRKIPMIVTYVTMALCLINFLLVSLLSINHDNLSSLIFMGADYKMFTLGIGQFWRLITYGFVHGSFLHLFMNMYSLFVLGNYLERQIGSLKYGIVLYVSVLCGALLNGALSQNSIIVGLSGGLYGLMAMYFLIGYKNHYLNSRDVLFILFINLMINFGANVGVYGHIGGFVAGFIMYLIMFDNKSRRYLGIATLALYITLIGYKYISNQPIEPIYAGTDMSVVGIYDDLGFHKTSERLANKLINKYYEVYK